MARYPGSQVLVGRCHADVQVGKTREGSNDRPIGQVRKGACKEHVYPPSPGITSIREAVFVGKGGGKERKRKKQASKLLYPLFTPPKTDPRNSQVSLYRGSSSPIIRGREETRAKVALAWSALRQGKGPERRAACWLGPHPHAAKLPGLRKAARTLALALARSCIWHGECLHL